MNRLANTPAQSGDWSPNEAIIGKPEKPHRVARIAPAGYGRLDAILGPRQRLRESSFNQPTAQPARDTKMQFAVEVDMSQFFLPDIEIRMMLGQDFQLRREHLYVPHSHIHAPSWYGESVGHYENGDTLVVDTIGMNDRTYVDNYRTPHTTQLHVVERFRLIEGGTWIEVHARIEDPGAFTTPWNAVQRYRRVEQGPMEEQVCAENNGDHFNQDLVPIPRDDTPDF